MIGPTWGLIDKMAHYVDLTKNRVTVICEADKTAQMACCFLTGAYILKAVRLPDSRPPAMRPSLQRISLWWGRKTPSEREGTGSL